MEFALPDRSGHQTVDSIRAGGGRQPVEVRGQPQLLFPVSMIIKSSVAAAQDGLAIKIIDLPHTSWLSQICAAEGCNEKIKNTLSVGGTPTYSCYKGRFLRPVDLNQSAIANNFDSGHTDDAFDYCFDIAARAEDLNDPERVFIVVCCAHSLTMITCTCRHPVHLRRQAQVGIHGGIRAGDHNRPIRRSDTRHRSDGSHSQGTHRTAGAGQRLHLHQRREELHHLRPFAFDRGCELNQFATCCSFLDLCVQPENATI